MYSVVEVLTPFLLGTKGEDNNDCIGSKVECCFCLLLVLVLFVPMHFQLCEDIVSRYLK
jgi:hypothetical protein